MLLDNINLLRSFNLFIFLLFSQPVKAQWRLIYKSQDIDSIYSANKAITGNSVNPIILIEQRGRLSKFLIVRYAHTKRKLVAKKSVWGFTDSTNVIWRYYDSDLYRVVSYNDLGVEYAMYRVYVRGRPNYDYFELAYSRTLDSKIEISWKKAMEDIPTGNILR